MKLLIVACLFGLSACKLSDLIGGGSSAPKERYEWVNGPVVHPVTGKNCSVGYCKDEPVPEGKSGCHSIDVKNKGCPEKK